MSGGQWLGIGRAPWRGTHLLNASLGERGRGTKQLWAYPRLSGTSSAHSTYGGPEQSAVLSVGWSRSRRSWRPGGPSGSPPVEANDGRQKQFEGRWTANRWNTAPQSADRPQPEHTCLLYTPSAVGSPRVTPG